MTARNTPEDFWALVGKDEAGCWLWRGGQTDKGYGRLWMQGERWMAHRLAYVLLGGTIPEGLELDHLCRVPLCVRPSHLEPVDHATNIDRARPTHCQRGHRFTPANTYTRRSSDRKGVKRRCLQCYRAEQRRRRERRKGV